LKTADTLGGFILTLNTNVLPLLFFLIDISIIADFLEVLQYGFVEVGFFFELGLELGFEGGEAGGEIEVVFFVGKADVAAGGEDVVEVLDAGDGGGAAEAFYVFVGFAGFGGGFFAPRVVRGGYGFDVFGGEFTGAAVDEAAGIAGVDEEDFAAAFACGFGAVEEPETGRGIWVLRKSLAGRLTMQFTRRASMRARRMSPSPELLDVREPLARTKPARPVGARW